MKIDVFSHILPQKFLDALSKKAPPGFYLEELIKGTPTLNDLDIRFRIMDKYGDLMQVLSLGQPPVELVCGPEDAAELARIGNDEMAELVFKYPDRFAGAVACLPMNDMDAALKETDRAINELRFRGVQIYTPINGQPIDLPEFMPLYEKMAQYNLPIWLHPQREYIIPDYSTEQRSKYTIASLFGWPYETTVAMTRLVFSGVLENYPNLKFITHHSGAMVPFFEQRIAVFYDICDMVMKAKFMRRLTKPPIEYFRGFYNDTALCGSAPALMCAYAFFGAEHLLFGTDMPYDNQLGDRNIRETIRSIQQMDIPESEKEKIFEDNARKLLRLPV
ncbi:amidohydrolase family protein [Chloroflexota bacterium]